MKNNVDGRIRLSRWLEIQEIAKAAAKEAIATGKITDLTPLARGYYQKYAGEHVNTVTVIKPK
jgi:hypothetical protein|tara:strand:- start:93 stop:281 length:189 start_codon:yes stop_codon:yes gene_type:complete